MTAATVAAVVLLSAAQTATSPLKVTELDQDGNTVVLGAGIPVVDLNSTLLLEIEPDALRDGLARTFGTAGLPPRFVEDLEVLQKLLQGTIERIEKLAAAHKRWMEARSQATLDEYNRARAAAATGMLPLINIAVGSPPLRARLNERLGELPSHPSTEAQDRVLFAVMNDELQRLRSDLDQHLRVNGVFVQLGGWLLTSGEQRPVHLPGWDRYEEQAPVDVQRFNLVLSAAQKQELSAVAKTAADVNSKGLEQAVLDHVRDAAGAASTLGTQCSATVRSALGNAQEAMTAAAAGARQLLRESAAALDGYDAFLSQIASKYRSGQTAGVDPAAFLARTSGDIAEFAQRTTELVSIAGRVQAAIADAPEEARPALDALAKAVRACETLLTQAKDGFAGVAAELGLGMASKINSGVLELGEKVLRLDAAMIPARTERSLRGTGAREAGDTLYFRLAAGRAGMPLTEVASKRMSLFMVLPHIDTSIVLIFANPNGHTAVKAPFQAAPSYSIVFKPGIRSAGYSRFVDAGFGLNVASLDLDMDSVPELGIGFVVSLFRDYVQGGIGYDVFKDHRYWFFGLRLPFGAASVPLAADPTAAGSR